MRGITRETNLFFNQLRLGRFGHCHNWEKIHGDHSNDTGFFSDHCCLHNRLDTFLWVDVYRSLFGQLGLVRIFGFELRPTRGSDIKPAGVRHRSVRSFKMRYVLTTFLALIGLVIFSPAQAQQTSEQICGNIPPTARNLVVICDIWKMERAKRRVLQVIETIPPRQCTSADQPAHKPCRDAAALSACQELGYAGVAAAIWRSNGLPGSRGVIAALTCFYFS